MSKATILVCEDEANLRKGLGMTLEDADYTAVFAADGEEALRQFRAQPVDVVLLDLKIPKGDGMELLKTFMTYQPPPKVIVLTAYRSLELAERAAKVGAIDYITKPFEGKAVLTAIEKALSQPVKKGRMTAS